MLLGRIWPVSVGLVLIAAATGQAAITYQTQVRAISVMGSGNPTFTVSAPDFLPFSESVATGIGTLGGGGTVRQDSELGVSQLMCASTMSIFDGNQGTTGRGSSTFVVSFVLDAPTVVDLAGMWNLAEINDPLYPRGTATAQVRLTNDGTNIYQRTFAPTLSEPDLQATLGFSSTLPAGTYRIEALLTQYVYVNPGFAQGTSSLSIGLSFIPAPGGSLPLAVTLALAVRRRPRR